MTDKTRRTVFFVSDRTGITAETLGHSLLTQFEFLEFEKRSIRFVDSIDRAREVRDQINRRAERDEQPPLVFCTIINVELRALLKTGQGVFFDFFESFVERLEAELGVVSEPIEGHSHGMNNTEQYFTRMEAVNFTLNHDDGSAISHLDQADLIMIGISRTGKTPTCLYMALHYGALAANFPLTEDELDDLRLPQVLESHRSKLFGLTTDPDRLQKIREQRLPNSRYASLQQCEFEVRQSEALYRKLGIPHLSTTTRSIEEISATIVDMVGLEQSKNPYLISRNAPAK